MGELLATISSRELAEWALYAELEPFGATRADVRAGIVAATVANVNRDPKKRKEPYTPGDFFSELRQARPAKPRQTVEEQIAAMERIATAFGGRLIRPGVR